MKCDKYGLINIINAEIEKQMEITCKTLTQSSMAAIESAVR